MKTKELREKRAALAKQANELLEKAHQESRNLSTEETQTFDKIHADIDLMKADIDRQEKQERINAEMAARAETATFDNPHEPAITEEQRNAALRSWAIAEKVDISDEDAAHATRCGFNPRKKEVSFRLSRKAPKSIKELREKRAQGDTGFYTSGSAGGYTVQYGFVAELEEALLAYGGVRNVATVMRTQSGNPLPWPTVNDTGNVGVRLSENTQVTEQDTTFGQLTFGSYKYSSKEILVSVELLMDEGINLEEYFGRALGIRIGRAQAIDFTTGTGSGQPGGVVTGANLGRTGATGQTTSITYADIVDLEHAVDPAYRPDSSWMMHDTTLRALKQLMDNYGRPLWMAGVAVGEPDTLLGHKYTINQQMPVMAANAKSLLFGHFSKYVVRDVGDVALLRLNERYADLHQVAFLAFARADGQLLDAGTHPIAYYANSAT